MKPPRIFLAITLVAVVAAIAFILWSTNRLPASDKEVKVLAYVGYDEEEYIQPIEEAIGAEVVVDTYVGGEQMYTKFTQAPRGTYDIVVIDAEYGQRLFAEHRILPLDETLWHYDDLFAKFSAGGPTRAGDSVYAAVARWGSIGLVFNTDHINQEQAGTYDILFNEEYKDRIGIYDWYLPNMGIISLSQGNESPYDLSQDQLNQLKRRLSQLRQQVVSIQPSPGQVLADLRSGSVWLAPGIGEWAAAALASEGLPIDWSVPAPGGIMWVEAFAIAADSDDTELAEAFVRQVMQPKQLALLATRKAYFSQVTRRSAYEHIPATARHYLKATDLSEVGVLCDQLQFRHLPGPSTSEAEWIAAWSEFKAGG